MAKEKEQKEDPVLKTGDNKKIMVKVVNPLRKYGLPHRRNQTVRIDAAIAEKAIKAGDAVKM